MKSKLLKIKLMKGLSIIVIMSVIFSSCTKESNTIPATPSSYSPPPPTFTAIIDGKPFTATSMSANSMGLTSTDTLSSFSQIKFIFLVPGWSYPGSDHQFGIGNGDYYIASYNGNETIGDCGYGWLNITENTLIKGKGIGGPNTYIVAGTFNFTVGGPNCGSDTTLHTITNGSFSNIIINL